MQQIALVGPAAKPKKMCTSIKTPVKAAAMETEATPVKTEAPKATPAVAAASASTAKKMPVVKREATIEAEPVVKKERPLQAELHPPPVKQEAPPGRQALDVDTALGDRETPPGLRAQEGSNAERKAQSVADVPFNIKRSLAATQAVAPIPNGSATVKEATGRRRGRGRGRGCGRAAGTEKTCHKNAGSDGPVAAPANAPGDQGGENARRCLLRFPVSYTHLTLPTNREV